MRKLVGLAAVAAVAALTGTVSALEIVPGTFSLRGEGANLPLHPNASMVGDDTSDPVITAHLESTSGPSQPYYVTWHTFTPSTTLLFKDIKSYSFDYSMSAGSAFGSGFRASFIMDLNNNGDEDYSVTGDDILHLDLNVVDHIPNEKKSGLVIDQPTGNLIGTPDSDNDLWGWAYAGGTHNYSDTLAQWGDVRVLSINIVHDAGDGDVFDVANVATAIPEPASLGLLGAGSLMLFRRRRLV